jgi:hypothetical protein
MQAMKTIAFILLFTVGLSAHARPTMGGGGQSEEDLAARETEIAVWSHFDGQPVHTITVTGLKRTKLISVEWLIHTKKDAPFSATQFVRDLQTLFNTGNLYDLHGVVEPDDSGGLHVTIILKDKWTLFPVVGAQGGGGSSTYGAGVFESNLLGYMVNASALFWTFNGTESYEINTNQEYVAGTDTMWSLDWQDNIEVQTPHFYNGASAGTFAWRRQQKEIMIGTHRQGPWRLFAYASVFKDSIFQNNDNLDIDINYSGLQQRFYPKAIYGRVDWNNYQENGFELTIQPTYANLFGPGPEYFAIEVDYKRVWKTGRAARDNTAIYLSASHMNASGPNFLYNVGGYYNVRGYSDMRELGRDIAFTNLEWRPYLFRYRWQILDLDLMVVQGCIFTDAGSAWGDSSLIGQPQASEFHPLWSAGVGLRINMVKFAGAIMRLDVAQTLSPNEGIGGSFGVGQFF